MKVLLAIDDSNASQCVVDQAVARPWPSGTIFCVLSIVDLNRWARLPMLIEDAERGAQTFTAAAADKLAGSAHQAFSDVRVGFPKLAIPDCAREWKADLIMVGSRGHGTLTRFLLGSVAQAILRSAPCSVEIVRPGPPVSPSSSRGMKILLATDGSECSTKAAHSLAVRPWPGGSQFRVISVRELLLFENQTMISSPCPVYPEGLLDQVLEDARKRAEQAVAEARQVLSSAALKVCEGRETPVGDARSAVLEEASTWGADLVVLGSHGKHGLDRLLLGSVSESVALHAHCSVEVIR